MDQETESPLTPLGLQLVSTGKLREDLSRPSVMFYGEAPAWQFLLWLIGPFLLVDIVLGPFGHVVEGPGSGTTDIYEVLLGTVFAACLGLIPVQVVILNCYAVFSNEKWWFRLLVLLSHVLPLSVAGIMGFVLLFKVLDWGINDLEIENGIRFFCMLPTFVLASQLPLWFMRVFCGWQFVRASADPADSEPASDEASSRQSLSIMHLLLATAVVAICLGLIRLAPVETLDDASVLWQVLGVFSGIAFGFSLVAIIYLHLFARIQSRLLYWTLAVGVPVLLVVMVVLVTALFIWRLGGFYWDEMEGFNFSTLIFSTIGLTFIVGLTSCFWLLQAHGWRIAPVRVRDTRSAN